MANKEETTELTKIQSKPKEKSKVFVGGSRTEKTYVLTITDQTDDWHGP